MTEILAVIPARVGSQRIPDKNIKPLNGRPLIEYTILSALSCQMINRVVISSNYTAETLQIQKYEGLEYWARPSYLCKDDITDMAVLDDILKIYGYEWDLIVYLRPTTPYRKQFHIDKAIELMLDPACQATGLRSVERMPESAFKCFTMPTPWLQPILEDKTNKTDWPEQAVTPTFKPNGYIDIARPEQIRAGKLWGDRLIGYETPHTPEIDTPETWDYAAWFGRRFVDPPLRHGKKEVKT